MIRAKWSRGVLGSVAAAMLFAVAVTGCGTKDEQEECFQLSGDLAQVTSDTLTADHLDAMLSPDGTAVLFTTDHWVEELENLKPGGERDIAWIEVPEPGEQRTPVPSVHDVGNGRRIEIEDLPSDDRSVEFPVVDRNKGELSWHPSGESFFAVIENNNRRDRIFWLRFVPGASGPLMQATLVRLIDDVGLATQSGDQFYYRGPAVSPDGRWLAYSRFFYSPSNQSQGIPEVATPPAIFAYDLLSDPSNPVVIRVTAGSSVEQDPVWSPDGNWIAFTSNGGIVGTDEVYKIRFDPDNPAVEGVPDGRLRLTYTTGEGELKLPAESFDPFWLRNGRIVFTSTRRAPCTSERRRNLWSMDAEGGDIRLVIFSRHDDHFVGGTNFNTNVSSADNAIVFSSRRNPVSDFNGQKDDLYLLRGEF